MTGPEQEASLRKDIQYSLIDEIQAALTEVKETYGGDFNAAVEAAERKLGVLREARKYAGVKTEKRPRRAPRRKKSQGEDSPVS